MWRTGYGFTYYCKGRKHTVAIRAKSLDEARERVACMSTAIYEGEIESYSPSWIQGAYWLDFHARKFLRVVLIDPLRATVAFLRGPVQ